MITDDEKLYCGLLCPGGSEQKRCDCSCPAECEFQHRAGFPAERTEVGRALWKLARNAARAAQARADRDAEEARKRIN